MNRRIPINQNGTLLSGANVIGINAILSGSTAIPDFRAPFVNILAIQGYYPLGTPAVFLQIFANAATLPADGVKPDISIAINPALNREFLEDYSTDIQTLQTPLSWCISTTQKTKTLDATANDYANFFIDVEECEIIPPNLHVAGDFTAQVVDYLQVYAEVANTAGTKRLWRVEGICNNGDPGTALFLMLFGINGASVAQGARPIWASKILTNDAVSVQRFDFGSVEGVLPKQSVSQVEKRGCSIFWSTGAGVLVTPGGTGGSIKAYYTF